MFLIKLVGNLKSRVEKAESIEEARSIIRDAGMLLSDDELAKISGGTDYDGPPPDYEAIMPSFPKTVRLPDQFHS